MALSHAYTDLSGQMLEVAFDHRIKYRDVFSMKYLYVIMHDWLCDQGWGSRSDPAFPETFYLHRWTQNSGEEIWIYWRLRRSPPDDSYMEYRLDVDFHVIGLKDYDAIYDGKKFKSNYGEVEVKLFSKVVFDPKKTWDKDAIAKSFRPLFFRRIIKGKMEAHKKQLHYETYRFLDMIKVYLKLRTYHPEPELARWGWDKDWAPL
jgi:hypothetical protein